MPFPYQEIPLPTKANSATSVDTVVFDYGMVLSGPPDPTAWARMRTLTGLDEERLHASYWKFRHDYDRGALTGLAYWRAVAADTGIALTDSQIAALFADDVDVWTRLNLPMVEWAQRLQRAGIRTGILSNIGDSIAEGVVARLPWLSGFYVCIWSHSLFMAKPEPAIFLKTARSARYQRPQTFSSSTTSWRTSRQPQPWACMPSSTQPSLLSGARCVPAASLLCSMRASSLAAKPRLPHPQQSNSTDSRNGTV